MIDKETLVAPWDDIVKDWEKIPIEAYRFLFSQVKDRYEYVVSESESITEKTIGFIKLTTGSSIAGIAYIINKPTHWQLIALVSFFIMVVFVINIALILPKGVIYKGSPPNEVFISYLDSSDLEATDKEKLIYYHELIRYQERIESMNNKIQYRAMWYRVSMTLSLILFILLFGSFISTIFHP